MNIVFQKNMLNRSTTPKYKMELDFPHETERGVETYKKSFIWPLKNTLISTDDTIKYDLWNIDIETYEYELYLNSLLELFRGKNSDFCESVATLYAVWLNRLNKNLSCADTDLIAEFKDWSEKKSRFYDSDLQDRILFMRRKNLIPDSNIK